MTARILTVAQVEKAKDLVRQGWSVKRIAEQFGCHDQTIRRATDHRYRETRRQDIERQRLRNSRNQNSAGRLADLRSVKEDAAARLAEIPADTRDFTARMFGDPIPGDPRRPWLNGGAE